MEININSNGFGNVGMGRDTFDATGVDSNRETTGASQASCHTSLKVSGLASHIQRSDLASAEPVAVVPDAALSRDDALGNLVKAAFNLPPPAMPDFQNVV
jgi:hypothetical protein